VPAAGARKEARAAAEEASEQLGRHSVRQASRELKPVVIGKNMERVEAYARMIGAETINDWLAGRKWSLELNEVWVREMMKQGRRVYDIGPDFARRLKRFAAIRAGKQGVPPPISEAYNLERQILKGYPNYIKRYIRTGRWEGYVLRPDDF
jgi:hypothetical protein